MEGSKCSVEFVDYGNIESDTPISHLHKEVLCSEVPIFINRFRLDGSMLGEDGEIDQSLLDMINNVIVEKNLFVEVLGESYQSPDKSLPKLCWITVGDIHLKKYRDIKTFFNISSPKNV
jgi:hypothetical protein